MSKKLKINVNSLAKEPLLHPKHPDCMDTKFGFEGGTVQQVGGFTYVFSTENFEEPKFNRVRLSVWKSSDGENFRRCASVRDYTGEVGDGLNFISNWTPSVLFSEEENRWVCFFVLYSYKGNGDDVFNLYGRIGVAKSTVYGRQGIEGPYEDCGAIFIPEDPQEWEGYCGQISFFPYKVGDRWLSFFGSNNVGLEQDLESVPQEGDGDYRFFVGLMESRSLNGPWRRLKNVNPVLLDPRFVENPVVCKIEEDLYVTFYDGGNKDKIPYHYSNDGVHWSEQQFIELPGDKNVLLNEVRTPLGILPRNDGSYDIYFTAYDGNNPEKIVPIWMDGFGCLWKANLKIDVL